MNDRSRPRRHRQAAKGTNESPIPATGADDVAFYQDVFWALLNSNEFMLNH